MANLLAQDNNVFLDSIIELIDDELRISHRVVAEKTENQEVSIRNLINKYRKQFESLGKVYFKNEAIKNSKNRVNEKVTYFLNEIQSTFLMTLLKNSETVIDFKLTLTKEFFRIRDILNQRITQDQKLEENLIALKFAQENFAVSEEVRVKMARDLFESLGLENQYLPTYVDGEPAFSLTHLLKKFGVKMSSQKVYLLLESENIIEKKSRKSSKKRIVKDKKGDEKEENILKTFWSIKDKKFGKNSVNSHGTSRQTQILFYEKTFEELLQKLELTQQIS
jgi:phage regulator Rha-like protein